MKLSVCAETVFADQNMTGRLKKIKAQGIDSVELWDARVYDTDTMVRDIAELGITLQLMSGHRDYSLINPDDRKGFLDELRNNIALAQKLGCPGLIIVSDKIDSRGFVINPSRELSPMEKDLSIYETLKQAAGIAEAENIDLVLEPLNIKIDHPGYYLDNSKLGFELISAINSPRLKILYDIYHLQIMEGDIIKTIEANLDHIGHIHVADVPGRHEPGTGEINFKNIISTLRANNYSGYVGLECFPIGDSTKALDAFKEIFS